MNDAVEALGFWAAAHPATVPWALAFYFFTLRFGLSLSEAWTSRGSRE